MAAQDQQRRLVGDCLGSVERRLEAIAIVGHLAEVHDVPSVRLETHADVVAVRERCVAVDRDVVVVVDADQVAETLVTSERGSFVADAFLEAAVAGNHERVMVDHIVSELRPQPPLGNRHAHGVGESLTERPGGDLDADRELCLGVAGRQ